MSEKYKITLKKELLYYVLTLFILAFIAHMDLLSDPLARLNMMHEKENYAHPFIYSFILYSGMLIVRKIIDFITGIFEKKSD